jgi:hypothetical protein
LRAHMTLPVWSLLMHAIEQVPLFPSKEASTLIFIHPIPGEVHVSFWIFFGCHPSELYLALGRIPCLFYTFYTSYFLWYHRDAQISGGSMGVCCTYEPKLRVTRIDTTKIYITNMTLLDRKYF